MTKTPFDSAAVSYDSDFTFSLIGKAQRDIVHNYLEEVLAGQKNLRILELNCGTGEDALFFAKKGCNVLATDFSEEMLKTAERKIESAGFQERICLGKIDINDLPLKTFEERFDIIFSNFGGINCITRDNLKELPGTFKRILMPSGRIILVILPSLTLWEFFYFTMKAKFGEAARRWNRSGIDVRVKGSLIRTYYYSPAEIKKIFSDYFATAAVRPVGFFIPPSYLENYFRKKPALLQKLKRMEQVTKNISMLSSFSDHFLIDMRLKG